MNSWLKKPSTTGGIVYLIVATLVVAAVVVVAVGHWRPGVILMGISFGLAFVMRAVLPDQRAGMLKVRRTALDLVTLAAASAGLLILVWLIPNRS